MGISWDRIHTARRRTQRIEKQSQKEESNASRFKSRRNSVSGRGKGEQESEQSQTQKHHKKCQAHFVSSVT